MTESIFTEAGKVYPEVRIDNDIYLKHLSEFAELQAQLDAAAKANERKDSWLIKAGQQYIKLQAQLAEEKQGRVDMHETHQQDNLRTNTLISELQAQLAEQKPYLKHKDWCDSETKVGEGRCTCGLKAILDKE